MSAITWYLNSPSLVEVAEAQVANGGLTAVVNSCGAELTVDVYEDDSLVVIRALDHRFRLSWSVQGCQDLVPVPLSVPLGNRTLIDGSTHKHVPIVP
jgi:hypothetical protein